MGEGGIIGDTHISTEISTIIYSKASISLEVRLLSWSGMIRSMTPHAAVILSSEPLLPAEAIPEMPTPFRSSAVSLVEVAPIKARWNIQSGTPDMPARRGR